MKNRADVTMASMIVVGVSAGDFASVALTADPPPGLVAAISFAGGRESRADNEVCDEGALVHAFAVLGRTSRAPMLWVCAQNDKYFGPDLAHRLHAEFSAGGGRWSMSTPPPSAAMVTGCFRRRENRSGHRWSIDSFASTILGGETY